MQVHRLELIHLLLTACPPILVVCILSPIMVSSPPPIVNTGLPLSQFWPFDNRVLLSLDKFRTELLVRSNSEFPLICIPEMQPPPATPLVRTLCPAPHLVRTAYPLVRTLYPDTPLVRTLCPATEAIPLVRTPCQDARLEGLH